MSLIEILWEGWSKLRRYYLVHFRKGYVERSMALRRGECKRCGTCCNFMMRCWNLDGSNQCKIYDTRAIQCRLYPIDERDIRGRFSVCGYYFITAEEAAREVATEPDLNPECRSA